MERRTIVVCSVVVTFALAVPALASDQDIGPAGPTQELASTSHPIGCTGGHGLLLQASLSIVSPLARPFAETIRDEVAAIWRRFGVTVRWTEASALRGSLDDGVVRLVVQPEGVQPAVTSRRSVIGWIQFARGEPRSLIRVSTHAVLDHVHLLVARPVIPSVSRNGVLQIARYRAVFARLIAWSLAHELGHYLFRTSSHSQRGLMRITFVPQELIGADTDAVSLAPVDTHWLTVRQATCTAAVTARAPR